MMFSVILIAAFIAPIAATDWCNIKCKNPGTEHTMCIYRSETQANGCQNIKNILTPEDREKIVNLHNSYRSALAGGGFQGWPKAANMRKVEYDPSLEEIALRWAVQCKVGHDGCRDTPMHGYVGQNYFTRWTSGSAPLDPTNTTQDAFNQWVNEIYKTSKSIVARYPQSAVYGHFAQVAWADSYKIGCAKISFQLRGENHNTFICDYGPGGNVEGGMIYIQDNPCSKCPPGFSCNKASPYPNLCSPGQGGQMPSTTPSHAKKSTASRKIQDSSLKCFVLTWIALLYQQA